MVKYGEGCAQCRGTGYLGRTGIFEVMEVNDKIRPLVTEKADAEFIKRTAIADGMVPLREGAVPKMLNGETTFDEVIRVTERKYKRYDYRSKIIGHGEYHKEAATHHLLPLT